MEKQPGNQQKTITVQEHERLLKTHIYYFICKGCDKPVERETYAFMCPKYGKQCGGLDSICKKKARKNG